MKMYASELHLQQRYTAATKKLIIMGALVDCDLEYTNR